MQYWAKVRWRAPSTLAQTYQMDEDFEWSTPIEIALAEGGRTPGLMFPVVTKMFVELVVDGDGRQHSLQFDFWRTLVYLSGIWEPLVLYYTWKTSVNNDKRPLLHVCRGGWQQTAPGSWQWNRNSWSSLPRKAGSWNYLTKIVLHNMISYMISIICNWLIKYLFRATCRWIEAKWN